MKKIRKISAVVLCIVMAVMYFPVAVMAADETVEMKTEKLMLDLPEVMENAADDEIIPICIWTTDRYDNKYYSKAELIEIFGEDFDIGDLNEWRHERNMMLKAFFTVKNAEFIAKLPETIVVTGTSEYAPVILAEATKADIALLTNMDEVSDIWTNYPQTITPESSYLPGDVNMDGFVNLSDARFAMRIAVNIISSSETAYALADVNSDGIVTIADARMLMRVSIGLESLNK